MKTEKNEKILDLIDRNIEILDNCNIIIGKKAFFFSLRFVECIWK